VTSGPTLIFDCDGVLADTERYGHLPAFNQTFAEFGLPVQWSEQDYAEKVLIGGGKERMRSLLTPSFVASAGLPADEAGQAEAVRREVGGLLLYTPVVRPEQFDVAIAPLADLPTTAARTRIILKEYAASGVPWVASARGPYLGLGEEEGGVLVSDDGWEHALLAMAGARFRRRQLRRRAEEWAKSHHIAVHADRWETVFRTAAASVRQVA